MSNRDAGKSLAHQRPDFWAELTEEGRAELRRAGRDAEWCRGDPIVMQGRNIPEQSAVAILRDGRALGRGPHAASRLYRSGDLIGFDASLDLDPGADGRARPTTATVSQIATVPQEVYALSAKCWGVVIPLERFAAILRRHDGGFVIQRILADRLYEADVLHDAAARGVDFRVAFGLLFLVGRYGDTHRRSLDIEQGDLASLLSLSVRTLCRHLSPLCDKNLIDTRHKRIVVYDIEGLRSYAQRVDRDTR